MIKEKVKKKDVIIKLMSYEIKYTKVIIVKVFINAYYNR